MIVDRRIPVPLAGSKHEGILATVISICASPNVAEFIVGITMRPEARRREYRDAVALLDPHFVILKGSLTRKDALDLEQDLQAEIHNSDIGREKYYARTLGARHRRSSGGSDRYATDRIYCVYLTWRSKPRYEDDA